MALNASDFNATCHAACTADEGCVELCVAESNPEIVVDPLSIVIAVVLIGLSGLFSGLTLGLMSLDPQGLKVMIAGGNPAERRQAERILPVREQGNLLLCTLLLGNTLVNAVIAIFLSELTSGLVGTLVTTALILIFGEILPQSVCSRHALAIGAFTLPIVQVFIVLCYPVAYPISVLLDRMLGREISGVFSRHGLLALVRLNLTDKAHNEQSGLTSQDGKLLVGALSYADVQVGDVMTPLERVFSLPYDATLDHSTIVTVLNKGHTRIPIYREADPSQIVALLFCKDLLGVGFERRLARVRSTSTRRRQGGCRSSSPSKGC